MYLYESKENILCDLVSFVLGGQFAAAEQLIAGKTEKQNHTVPQDKKRRKLRRSLHK